MTGGILLGMMADMPFETECISLTSGDCIVMFTDGITEVMDLHEEEFGEERVIDLMQKYKACFAQLMEKIIKEVNQFSLGTPQADDITMDVLKTK